jgi:hypothetical protein
MATFVANNMNNNRGEGLRGGDVEAGEKKQVVLEIRPSSSSSETLDGAGGKRKYSRAFSTNSGANNYDDARYGQHIGDAFFTTNYGHGVYISDTARLMSTFAARTGGGVIYTQREMNEWREFYRANRNLFNV